MRHIFSRNLTHFREKKKLEQAEIAEHLGVTVQRYRAWESGIAYPKYTAMIRLCDYLGYRDIYTFITTPINLNS